MPCSEAGISSRGRLSTKLSSCWWGCQGCSPKKAFLPLTVPQDRAGAEPTMESPKALSGGKIITFPGDAVPGSPQWSLLSIHLFYFITNQNHLQMFEYYWFLSFCHFSFQFHNIWATSVHRMPKSGWNPARPWGAHTVWMFGDTCTPPLHIPGNDTDHIPEMSYWLFGHLQTSGGFLFEL